MLISKVYGSSAKTRIASTAYILIIWRNFIQTRRDSNSIVEAEAKLAIYSHLTEDRFPANCAIRSILQTLHGALLMKHMKAFGYDVWAVV